MCKAICDLATKGRALGGAEAMTVHGLVSLIAVGLSFGALHWSELGGSADLFQAKPPVR